MKKWQLMMALAVTLSATTFAQQTPPTEITKKNSWLKAGLTAGVPVGNVSDYSSFTLGLDLKGQLMTTNHLGVGLTTGYNHFFAKNNLESFGTVPVGAFIRVYPKAEGFFVGSDLGYSFLTNANGADGGFYIRPQVGYHNYNWNFFGFYNNIFRSDNEGGGIGTVGIGFNYNIRFN